MGVRWCERLGLLVATGTWHANAVGVIISRPPPSQRTTTSTAADATRTDPEVAAEADEVLDKHVRAAISVYFTHIPGTDYFFYHPKQASASGAVGRDLLDEMGGGDSSDSDSGAGDYDFADANEGGHARRHHRCVPCRSCWRLASHALAWCIVPLTTGLPSAWLAFVDTFQ